MLRRLLRLSAGTLIGLLLLAVSAQPVQAGNGSPPCGVACDGQDPATYKALGAPYWYCAADAITVETAPTSGVILELRYSPRCETTWGRYTLTQWATPFVLRHYSYNSDWTLRATAHGRIASTNWTRMLDDHNRYNRVCVEQWWWDHLNDPPDEVACTASY